MRLNELLDSAMSLISALDLMEADCDLEDTCHSQKLSQRREGVRRFFGKRHLDVAPNVARDKLSHNQWNANIQLSV